MLTSLPFLLSPILTSQILGNNNQVTKYNFSFDPTNGNPDLLNPPPNVSIIPNGPSIQSSLQNIQNYLNPQSPLGPIYQIPVPPNNGSHPPGAFYRMHDSGLLYYEPNGSFYQASGSHRVPGSINPNVHNSRTFTVNGNTVSVQNNTQPLQWTFGMAQLGLRPDGKGSYTSNIPALNKQAFIVQTDGSIFAYTGNLTTATTGTTYKPLTKSTDTYNVTNSSNKTNPSLPTLEMINLRGIPISDKVWRIGVNSNQQGDFVYVLPNGNLLKLGAESNDPSVYTFDGKNWSAGKDREKNSHADKDIGVGIKEILAMRDSTKWKSKIETQLLATGAKPLDNKLWEYGSLKQKGVPVLLSNDSVYITDNENLGKWGSVLVDGKFKKIQNIDIDAGLKSKLNNSDAFQIILASIGHPFKLKVLPLEKETTKWESYMPCYAHHPSAMQKRLVTVTTIIPDPDGTRYIAMYLEDPALALLTNAMSHSRKSMRPNLKDDNFSNLDKIFNNKGGKNDDFDKFVDDFLKKKK